MLARQDAVAHGVFPALMFGQADRKLDHLLRLEFRGGDVVQHVAIVGGGGGEFHDTSGVDALQDFEAERRMCCYAPRPRSPAAVCRASKLRNENLIALCFRRPRSAPCPGAFAGTAEKCGSRFLVVGIDLAPVRVADAQGLHRADNDASMGLKSAGVI